MNPVLIEPTDVLFFRDAIPMSAGQGKGAGARMPFPSTLHEAFRASLLRANGGTTHGKSEQGRPPSADRKGDWYAKGHDGRTFIATKAFRSLRAIGPLPWQQDLGVLFPVPLDVARDGDKVARLQLWCSPTGPWLQTTGESSRFSPLCLPLATTPPDKHRQLRGWWTSVQMRDYLKGVVQRPAPGFSPTSTDSLWAAEHRIGVEIEPGSFASKEGQLYAGSYLRLDRHTRFVAWTEIADPSQASGLEAEAREREREQLGALNWLLVGGEFRLARLWQSTEAGQPFPDYLGELAQTPAPAPDDGPCLLKWVLVTPAIFAHGSLPGWCADTKKDRLNGPLPIGQVCLELPGRARLISWCLGRSITVSGWDVVEGRAKPTMLAAPEGSVYYFLCENRAAATALAKKLHWQPRSDFYGEKGCGYGLVSFDVQMHPASASLADLRRELFPVLTSRSAPRSATIKTQSAIRNPQLELHDTTTVYTSASQPHELQPPTAIPEPWSHPWHDQLGLRYHRAIAAKFRSCPDLRGVAVGNIERWTARNDYPPSVLRAFQQWRELLTTAPLEALLSVMTDPSERGHQLRQNTPFAGLLNVEERRRIREDYEKATTR